MQKGSGPTASRRIEMEDKLFAKGKRGLIYLEEKDGKKIIVKVKNPKSDADTLDNEANFLKVLNTQGIGPGFYSFDGENLRMEFIEGERILDFIGQSREKEIRKVVVQILDQMFLLDSLGINKFEMTHPYKHIIIRDGKPVLIDFERCRRTERPKNVSQFLQFITGKEAGGMLAAKGIALDKDRMIALAKAYKKDMTKGNYERIREEVAG